MEENLRRSSKTTDNGFVGSHRKSREESVYNLLVDRLVYAVLLFFMCTSTTMYKLCLAKLDSFMRLKFKEFLLKFEMTILDSISLSKLLQEEVF